MDSDVKKQLKQLNLSGILCSFNAHGSSGHNVAINSTAWLWKLIDFHKTANSKTASVCILVSERHGEWLVRSSFKHTLIVSLLFLRGLSVNLQIWFPRVDHMMCTRNRVLHCPRQRLLLIDRTELIRVDTTLEKVNVKSIGSRSTLKAVIVLFMPVTNEGIPHWCLSDSLRTTIREHFLSTWKLNQF